MKEKTKKITNVERALSRAKIDGERSDAAQQYYELKYNLKLECPCLKQHSAVKFAIVQLDYIDRCILKNLNKEQKSILGRDFCDRITWVLKEIGKILK